MTVSGGLKFLVLKELSVKKQNGSSILRAIEDKTGWRVSCGSFYPLMKELVELNFVTFSQNANIKIYEITVDGKSFIDEADSKKDEILRKIRSGVKFLEILGEKAPKEFIDNIGNEMRFLPLHETIVNLKSTLFSLNIKTHGEEINEILKETTNKLRRLR